MLKDKTVDLDSKDAKNVRFAELRSLHDAISGSLKSFRDELDEAVAHGHSNILWKRWSYAVEKGFIKHFKLRGTALARLCGNVVHTSNQVAFEPATLRSCSTRSSRCSGCWRQ